MRDLPIFETLRAGDTTQPGFPDALQALGALSLAERAPYLGAVEAALSAASPAVRAAALRLHAGASGRLAFVRLLRALDDEDEGVRRAAVETFQRCAERQPARRVHLLFHPRADVRRLALSCLPQSARSQALYLLSDPATSDVVRSWLRSERRPHLPEHGLELLLSLWRDGKLDDTEAAELLDDVDADGLLRHARYGRPRAAVSIQRVLEALWAEPGDVGSDDLDAIIAIVLRAPPAPRARLLRRVAEAFVGRGKLSLKRLAAAVVKSVSAPSLDAVALLALCDASLLASERLELELRQQAVSRLAELDIEPRPLAEAELLPLLRALVLDAEAHIDLALAAALLRFAPRGEAYAILRLGIGEDALLSAIRGDLSRAAPLLSSRSLPLLERKALLGGLRARSPIEGAELLALVIWSLPRDQIELESLLDPQLALEVSGALLSLEQAANSALKDRKQARLAEALATSLLKGDDARAGVARALAFATTWLENHAESSALGPRIFGRVARELSAEQFVELCRALEPRLLERLLPLLPRCFEIPFGKELALAHALAEGPGPQAVWAQTRIGELQAPEPSCAAIACGLELTEAEIRHLAGCSDAEFDAVLMAYEGRLITGLCAALARRPARRSLTVTLALLGCCDEPELVAAQLSRFIAEDAGALTALDVAVVAAYASAPDLPLFAAAWLWRWERQAFRFCALALARSGGFLGILSWSLALESRWLRESIWAAVARALRLLGSRHKDQFQNEVGDGRALIDAAIEQLDTELGECAAELLLTLRDNRVAALDQALPRVREKLPDVSAAVASELGRLLIVQGLSSRREGARQHLRLAAQGDIDALRRSPDLGVLEAACESSIQTLVEEAVLRLLELPGGCARLLRALQRGPRLAHAGIIADSLPLWPDADAVDDARRWLEMGAPDPELAFRLALAFVERGERAELERAFMAAELPCDDSWFKAKDYERLCQFAEPDRVASALAASPHPHAYRPALRRLLTETGALSDVQRQRQLTRFLAQGRARDIELRKEAAAWLMARGNDYGFPLLFSEALSAGEESILRSVGDERLVAWVTEGVLVSGENEETLVDLLAAAPIGTRDPALERVLLEATDEDAAKKAVAALDSRRARKGKLEQLAQLFAWGFRVGLMLTGRHHRPHMTSDGAYGYVRRNDPRVYVTPLPLLRGDENGREVVEGLILHELGHHVYHSGPQNDKVWARAESEKIHGVLNLVADEHLERNLRALKADWGDSLKRLAAYAFQHADKEADVGMLLRVLGPNAFFVLSECRLDVSHVTTRVKVDSGAILQALEARGHAFARFMRALRMGLGNRQQDALVDQALTLFPPSFRKLEMPALLEIARELLRLFGNDAFLLDCFGGAETVDEGARAKTKAAGTLTDELVQPEVERILDPRKLKGSFAGRGGSGGKLGINVSGVPQFDPIENVVRLVVDPAAQREVEREVARPAAKLREFFAELGLQRQPVTRRTSGTRLDRARLSALVLYGDPRVLSARQPRFDTDLFLGVLVDCSGSMEACDNIIKARRFAVLVAQAVKGLAGVDLRVFGFTDKVIYDAGDAQHCAAAMLEAGGGNNDAAGLLHLADAAKRSHRKAKVLVVVSDGLPTECSTEALKSLVERLETRENMVIAQVAVRPLEEQCFRHYVRLDDGSIEQVVHKFGQTIARLVRKAIA